MSAGWTASATDANEGVPSAVSASENRATAAATSAGGPASDAE